MSEQRVRSTGQQGFTLVELMIVVIIGAILAAVALPAYQNHVKTSRAKAAAADLVALSASVETIFQRQLAYPTSSDMNQFKTWKASSLDFFDYSYHPAPELNVHYKLEAVGKNTMSGCKIILKSNNLRSAEGQCGGMTSW